MARLALALLVTTLTVFVHTPATAALITGDPSSEPGAQWLYDFSVVYRFAGVTSYDAAADILTLVTHPSGPAVFESSSFTINASVDHTGQLHGGTAIWLGGVPSLGVPSGTTLLAGNIIGVEYGYLVNGMVPGVEFVIQVTKSFSGLGLGPTIGYENYVFPWNPSLGVAPWSISFESGPYSNDALFNVRSVPHAPTVVLYLGGLGLCLALVRLARRRRAAGNVAPARFTTRH